MTDEAREPLDLAMARLADGDRSAFSAVYRTLWPEVRRLCRALLKNAADADDVAQQSMEKILSRGAEYDPERPARPWALGIATWECRTHRRKRFRKREDALSSETTEAASDSGTSLEDQAIQGDLVHAA